jgi:hypothetical protein
MRLILIDNHSGYIFGDTADMPGLRQDDVMAPVSLDDALVAAARALDASIGVHGRTYSVTGRGPRDTSTGYHVYRSDVGGSDQLPSIFDGQDAETVAAVERTCEYYGYVRCHDDR